MQCIRERCCRKGLAKDLLWVSGGGKYSIEGGRLSHSGVKAKTDKELGLVFGSKTRETFVSESIMIASAKDRSTAIIEKSPAKIGIHKTESDYIICANNFQSDAFKDDSLNIKNIRTSSSILSYLRFHL